MDRLRKQLLAGMVLPAHPLALLGDRTFDDRSQLALGRYYLAAGAGGLAVGVHTTQFAIHDPRIGLYEPVLEIAAQALAEVGNRSVIGVAGLIGSTQQAVREAEIAVRHGYHAGLLSLGSQSGSAIDEMIAHCRAVAEVIPVFGFYLQEKVGGVPLSYDFWRRFLEIDNVVAIKVAPFDRYKTLDVIRAVVESDRQDVALYTGNDDAIVQDLSTTYQLLHRGQWRTLEFSGGLLGHWSVWTKRAVETFYRALQERTAGSLSKQLQILSNQITAANGVLFDVQNNFRGCIAGLMEVLRRQGLVKSAVCLNESEQLSAGQADDIDRIYRDYRHLTDDDFVRENIDHWFR